MKSLRTLTMAVLLAHLAACGAAAAELADLVPVDAKAFVETADAAGLRQMLLESKFWAALQQTEAVRQWHASPRHAEMKQRVERLLANLEMSRDQALRTYLGGRSAVVLLPSGEKKPFGVFLTEADNAMAERLVQAVGGQEVDRYRDVAIWEVRKEDRVDRMAFAGGVLMISGARGDELERVLEAAVGGGAPLGAQGNFVKAVNGLPAGWRVRAWAAEAGPTKCPGAVAMYPSVEGRLHFEWQIVGPPPDLAISQPAALTGPEALPDTAVAAVASVFRPAAIWNHVQAKVADDPNRADRLRQAEMGVRGWFPGYTMEAIVGAFGPEAALAILKGDGDAAPGLLGMVRLTGSGQPVATAFKNCLAARAMILGALGRDQQKPVVLNVREEAYGGASLVVIEAPDALRQALGDWADDVALTVAVTDKWLIVGTTPAGVKKTIDTAAGNAPSLAAAVRQAGEKVPAEPVTRWGIVQVASGADIVLGWAEKLLGRERVEEAEKLVNLAEMMRLVKRMLWQRTDTAEAMRGSADVQAID